MALTQEQMAEVADILQEHPDWTNSQVRAEAALSPKELFAVRHLRARLGVPEPVNASASGKPANKGGRPRKNAKAAEADTLDDSAPATEPSGPKRRGGPSKAPKSPLAPILPRIAQTVAGAVLAGTYKATKGRAPMTPTEAKAVAVPAVRIVDRTVAKHWKASGKVGENSEDVGLIAMTILAWLVGVIIASISGTPRTAGIVATPDTHPDSELFTGSEPAIVSNATPAARPATANAPTPNPTGDESDLFAGSEPLAAGTTAGVTPMTGRPAGPNVPPVSEAVWSAIMPTDLGGEVA
ncbi:MAG TPA: hypothetical protein VGA61_17305 [Anaerolineae bacterium]